MLYFAMLTVGYLLGVFTALAVFPPRVKEIEEQEREGADLPSEIPSYTL